MPCRRRVCTLARFRVASRPRWAGCSKIVPSAFRPVRSATVQVMFVDGQAVASRATDNDALMRLAAYLEEETDDTYLKVYSLGDDFWDNDAYCVTSDSERVRRAMESGGNAWA